MTFERLPQPRSVTYNDLLRGVLSTLPNGGIDKEEGAVTHKFAQVMADSSFRVMTKLQEMQDELNPGRATVAGALPDWEGVAVDTTCYNIPGLTEAQRQLLVVASIRGGIPNLTASALKARLDAEFTPTFTVTEVFTRRYGDGYGNRYARSAYLYIIYSRTGLNNATVELIRCFVSSTLPVAKVWFIQVEA